MHKKYLYVLVLTLELFAVNGCGSGTSSVQDAPASDTEPTTTPTPLSSTKLIDTIDTQTWEWFFPFRYGHYNPNGSIYNSGSDACSLLGIDATVEESSACDIYTLAHFKEAINRYNDYARSHDLPQFLTEGSLKLQAEELAAFLSNVSRETSGTWASAPVEEGGWIEDDPLIGMPVWKGGLYWIEEIGHTTNPDGTVKDGGVSYVDENSVYTPVENRSYHGRGPIQLSWNYNYGYFSQWLYENNIYPEVITAKDTLLYNPGLVSKDAVVAFLSAIWFWMTPQGDKPSAHAVMMGRVDHVSSGDDDQGLPPLRAGESESIPIELGESINNNVIAYRFGTTINIINGGIECNGAAAWHEGPPQRVSYYEAYSCYFNDRFNTQATPTSVGYIALESVNDESNTTVRFATCYVQQAY